MMTLVKEALCPVCGEEVLSDDPVIVDWRGRVLGTLGECIERDYADDGETYACPVCGEAVTEQTMFYRSVYNGYIFGCDSCCEKVSMR